MKLILAAFSLFLLACGGPPARIGVKYPHSGYLQVGYLHANECMQGSSFILYKNKSYPFGGNTTEKLTKMVNSISKDQYYGADPVTEQGCVKIYKIRFSGEFEREASLTAYGNNEDREVIQVYQFQML